jgi:hypothetical protein
MLFTAKAETVSALCKLQVSLARTYIRTVPLTSFEAELDFMHKVSDAQPQHLISSLRRHLSNLNCDEHLCELLTNPCVHRISP